MEKSEEQFTFKSFFIPLTTLKAIHWIVIVGLVAFFNMLFNGFVFDDFTYIVNNPGIRSLNLSSLVGANLFTTQSYYRPFQEIYFAIVYGFSGSGAFFYHFSSLILHILNVILLFILFKRFFPKTLSLFLSLIFLVHPVQVESVSFISASGNLLSFLFGISAFLLSLKNDLSRKRLWLILFLLLLSYLTRETGILFLLTIILYKIIFKGKNIFRIALYGLGSVLLYGLIRFGAGNDQSGLSGFVRIYSLPLASRIYSIPEIIYYYLKIAVYPVNLAIDQQWVVTSVNFSGFYYPLLIDSAFFGVIFLSGFLIRKNKKNFSAFIFFALIFLSGLSLVLQIIPLDMTVADRWFYFPLAGLLGMIAVVCTSIKLPGKNIRILFYAIGFLVIMLLTVRTIIRNTDWQNNITLYSHDSKISDNAQLEQNLGYEYYLQKNFEKSLYYTNRSIKLLPNESNINNLATFYLNRGEIEKGQQYYREALTYNVYPKAGHISIMKGIYQGLAWTYIYSGQFEEAEKTIQKAFSAGYITDKMWEYLAISQYNLDDRADALSSSGRAKNILQNAEANYVYNQILNNQPIKLK